MQFSGIRNLSHKLSLLTGLVFLLSIGPSSAGPQFDAPYYQHSNKHKARWEAENREIKSKLAALEKRFGKKPNIIYILGDDIGWGELGWQGGGKVLGQPTPNLDQMAFEGMRFWSAYAEPSCTPTRIALNTGRHPVRTGVNGVMWPGNTLGLPSGEITIASLLKKAGYHTAMWGKWHMGDLREHAPENRGYDYAYYGLYNGAPFMWADAYEMYQGEKVGGPAYAWDFPGEKAYQEEFGQRYRLRGFLRGEAGKGRVEVAPINGKTMDEFEDESIDELITWISEKAKSDKPFFAYWATYAHQVAGSPSDTRFDEGVDYVNNNAVQLAKHDKHVGKLLAHLEKTGIAENTLVVWYSDNGPMYGFYPNTNYSWLKGGKSTVWEGGVRVPAMVWWPGVIEPGQDPMDIIHVTDLFTTAVNIAGVIDEIPDDRVIDGIDQTTLLLNGEGYGRRFYMFHYEGQKLGAIRINRKMKAILHEFTGGGVPQIDIYNVLRDPGEKFGEVFPHMWIFAPMQDMMGAHMGMIRKFPHRVNKWKRYEEVDDPY